MTAAPEPGPPFPAFGRTIPSGCAGVETAGATPEPGVDVGAGCVAVGSTVRVRVDSGVRVRGVLVGTTVFVVVGTAGLAMPEVPGPGVQEKRLLDMLLVDPGVDDHLAVPIASDVVPAGTPTSTGRAFLEGVVMACAVPTHSDNARAATAITTAKLMAMLPIERPVCPLLRFGIVSRP